MTATPTPPPSAAPKPPPSAAPKPPPSTSPSPPPATTLILSFENTPDEESVVAAAAELLDIAPERLSVATAADGAIELTIDGAEPDDIELLSTGLSSTLDTTVTVEHLSPPSPPPTSPPEVEEEIPNNAPMANQAIETRTSALGIDTPTGDSTVSPAAQLMAIVLGGALAFAALLLVYGRAGLKLPIGVMGGGATLVAALAAATNILYLVVAVLGDDGAAFALRRLKEGSSPARTPASCCSAVTCRRSEWC